PTLARFLDQAADIVEFVVVGKWRLLVKRPHERGDVAFGRVPLIRPEQKWDIVVELEAMAACAFDRARRGGKRAAAAGATQKLEVITPERTRLGDGGGRSQSHLCSLRN